MNVLHVARWAAAHGTACGVGCGGKFCPHIGCARGGCCFLRPLDPSGRNPLLPGSFCGTGRGLRCESMGSCSFSSCSIKVVDEPSGHNPLLPGSFCCAGWGLQCAGVKIRFTWQSYFCALSCNTSIHCPLSYKCMRSLLSAEYPP